MKLSSASIHHEFLAIDEGFGTLLHVNELDPSNDWTVPIGHPQPRDMQLVGNGRVLIGHHHGWSEFEIASGKMMSEFTGYEGVTAVRRQPGGHTIVAGVDIAGASGVVILELDETNAEFHRAIYPGDYVRLIRQTAQGTVLMSCNDRIREGDREGNYLREFPVEGFEHAWKSVRQANGNLLVSGGYGAFMVELDPDGAVIRKFGEGPSGRRSESIFPRHVPTASEPTHHPRELAGPRRRFRRVRRAADGVRRAWRNRLAMERREPHFLAARRARARWPRHLRASR